MLGCTSGSFQTGSASADPPYFLARLRPFGPSTKNKVGREVSRYRSFASSTASFATALRAFASQGLSLLRRANLRDASHPPVPPAGMGLRQRATQLRCSARTSSGLCFGNSFSLGKRSLRGPQGATFVPSALRVS